MAGQSHLARVLPFSPLSFPRKRESSAPKPVTRPWIPACAGMTATERSQNPNAIAPIEGEGNEYSTMSALRVPRFVVHPFLNVNRPAGDRQCRFLDRPVQGWMGMAGPRDVLGGSAEFHAHDDLGDQIAGIGPQDMSAQDPIGGGVGENLHETVGHGHGPGRAIGGEGKFADLVSNTLYLELLLGLAH